MIQLNPQAATLGYMDAEDEKSLKQNHILLIFKEFTYDWRETETMKTNIFLHIMAEIREIEKTIGTNNKNKLKRFNMKSCVESVLCV